MRHPCRSGDQEAQLKLFARLRCCVQLDALLDSLLQVGCWVQKGARLSLGRVVLHVLRNS